MNGNAHTFRKTLGVCLAIFLSSTLVLSQQARSSLRGVVKDELGASVVGAEVTITDAAGVQKKTTSNGEGAYSFTGVAPGKYVIRASAKGFAVTEDEAVDIVAGQRQTFDITLKVTIEQSNVTVAGDTPLSTESTNNANQTVISGKDLDALPDDPDELAAALQALAGPSIGPNGGQIFIDGFSGGLNLNFNDESLNSRNPFAISSSKRTPYQVRQFGGSFSGPLKAHKASFFIEANRNETDDNE